MHVHTPALTPAALIPRRSHLTALTPIHLHSIVDHQIVETIWNNRTAMVTYSAPVSESATAVKLVGITAGITADITPWDLDVANNYGPQP